MSEKTDKILELFRDGKSFSAIAKELQTDRRWVARTIRKHYGDESRALVAQASKHPPIDIVPDGFHLSAVSTTVDAYGHKKSQSFRSKSGAEGDVVPDSGNFAAPDGMFAERVSTLVDGQTGAVKQQWVKAKILPEDQLAAMRNAVKKLVEEMPPLPEVPKPEQVREDLCTVYTMTDCHVGMLAWGRETGEPWDLKIAERVLVDAFTRMVLSSPQSKKCIVNQLGDFLHFDSLKSVTPEHGNLLDADSRYQKIVEVAVRILRRIIDVALVHHEEVYVEMHEGNHDPAGSVWLRVLFAQLYENNDRVHVEQSPLPYVAHQHGKTLICFHHGHLTAKENLPLIFAARFREQWGTSKSVYIHCGHKHNSEEKEYPGVKVIQHPTLAAPDAYAARGGFISKRQATAITYHVETGEYCRNTILPQEE